MRNNNYFKVFGQFLSKNKKEFTFLFVLLLFQGLLASLSIMSMVPLADFIIDNKLSHVGKITQKVIDIFTFFGITVTFISISAQFILVNFIKSGFDIAVNYMVTVIKYSVVRSLVKESIDKFYSAKWQFFSNSNNGLLLNTLNKEVVSIADSFGNITSMFALAIQLVIYFAIPLYINFVTTFLTILIVIIFSIPILFLKNISYKLGKLNTETGNKSMGILSEMLQASRVILSFSNQGYQKGLFLNAFDQHTHVTLKSQTLSTAVSVLFRPFAMLAAIIAIGISMNNFEYSISELAVVLWSLLAAMPILSTILQNRVNMSNFMPSYHQLKKLIENAEDLHEKNGLTTISELTSDIKFKNVTFSYLNRSATLDDISIQIKKGETIAIVGESGSGKSTIVDLLLGFQEPSLGEIIIDGNNLDSIDKHKFRRIIGYVSQDSFLFDMSIKDNLLWAKNDATESEIWEALKLSNADQFVKDSPMGLNTMVGNRGTSISGGQRQRIALARALIKKPDILILDEATSALDSESETLIQNSIDLLSKSVTILIVAHRLSTIMNADFVYVLEKGRVVEKGTFSNLSSDSNSKLYRMINLQSGIINHS